jgi:hypothetical protein
MPSTFYHDGFRDALNGSEPAPVDQGVYGQEYLEGHREGQLARQAAGTLAAQDQQEPSA